MVVANCSRSLIKPYDDGVLLALTHRFQFNHVSSSTIGRMETRPTAVKFLLVAIASGLWANALLPFIHASKVEAQMRTFGFRPALRSGFVALCSFSLASRSAFDTLTSFRIVALNCSNG